MPFASEAEANLTNTRNSKAGTESGAGPGKRDTPSVGYSFFITSSLDYCSAKLSRLIDSITYMALILT